MNSIKSKIIEEMAPGADPMNREWMASFWEVFTECVIELNALHIVTNARLNYDGESGMIAMVGKPFIDSVIEKDRDFVTGMLEHLRSSSVPYARFQAQAAYGKYYRWTLMAHFEDGVYLGCRGVCVDVTEQTLKEITLNWQRAVIEWGADFVSIADMNGNWKYANPGAYKMTGYGLDSGMLDPEKIYPPEHMRAIIEEGMPAVLEHGRWTKMGELVRRDGKRVPIEHTMYSVQNAQDETILIATIIHDTTVFLENKLRLEEARNAAEAANAAKSEFLSRMSHEIRTPMNAIIGMINIGLGTDDVERKNYCFRRADSASKHLLGVINDILDMSKIEADKFELSYSTFDFEEMLMNVTNIANISAEKKEQDFVVNLACDVPAYIVADKLRLSQVITNLLSNAVKFTSDKGNVVLSIRKVREADDAVELQIEVADSGIGITKDQQAKLFTSFNQADANIAQSFGGTGLGLAISKRIVEMMGGKIWIESELGQGSKFIFTLSTEKVEGKPKTVLREDVNIKDLRILAVDDSEEMRDYFEHVMSALKLPCDVASNGYQALHMIKHCEGHKYDLFFVDWQMDDMDGIELTRKIKEINGDDSLIIMVSAHDWNSVEKEASEAGVSLFLPKPLFPSTIVNAINACMGVGLYHSPSSASNGIEKDAYDFSGSGMLIVEDIDINREIMSAILKETNISIDYAENGKIAVDMYKASPEKYNLILMDVNMPVMDGYEATTHIRALDSACAKNVPIIAMTANVFAEDIEKCIAVGMNDHIGKPIEPENLFKKLAASIAGQPAMVEEAQHQVNEFLAGK